MALNFPAAPTLNQVYIDPMGISWKFDSIKWEVIRNNRENAFVGTKLGFFSGVTLTTSLTPLEYTEEIYDTGQFFNYSVNPSRVFFNRTGYYRVNAQIVTGTTGSGASYSILIRKNGSITLQTSLIAANQAAIYDEVMEFSAGDYVEILASESNGIGELTTDSFLDVNLVGYSPSSQVGSVFSGVKLILSSEETTITDETAVTWDSAEYNVNASVLGDLYWNIADNTKLYISTTAYYCIRSAVMSNALGSSDSYTITLKKNGSFVLDSISMGANDSVMIDTIFKFDAGDYIQLFISNSQNIGGIKNTSYLQLTRLGV